ncbi:hypothetical protein [Marinovum sp.]|uniref:hypothetical protein n=1 Tax=Marinovum sp. TaxID=2024839 RepID=UPI002B273387|nr:hypothetical protein [Marinovum sp.]
MTQPLTLLHSAEVHRRTFDVLRDAIAPMARLDHQVRSDWLARARNEGMTRQLAAEIRKAVTAAPGPVLCTCTTLGEAAAEAGAIRIDQPMMAAAAQSDGRILLVCALKTSVAPSRALLQTCLDTAGTGSPVTVLVLEEFWPLFEAGQTANFCAAIAAAVIEAVQARPDFRTVVLAQASMAEAVHLLDGVGPRVLAAPEPALRHALSLA